jgi:DNA-binding NtrC family response regulator
LTLQALAPDDAVLPGLVGRGAAMQGLIRRVERVIDTDVTVVIQGESGTGKELVARAIYLRGPRSRRPFVAINCAAIAPSLQESEMFGHERGAFTGADRTHAGWFEQAHRGTLFLDELGELSPSAQAAMLRAVQEGVVRRVGGAREIPVDVRLLCATRRDLRAEMDAGRFRDDLYYRLVVFPLRVPALRERGDDLPLLVDHALDVLQPGGRRVTGVHADALVQLARHPWPGNVRELFNVIQQSLLTCRGTEILAEHLPSNIPDAGACCVSPDASICGYGPLCRTGGHVTLDEVKSVAFARALRITGGQVREAASMLGVSRATIYRPWPGEASPPRRRMKA